uniref:Uncharacterized protein n=1 Tax=Anopheles atroparvus TaxID=41427 RepID=A0A182IVR4_ANOAO
MDQFPATRFRYLQYCGICEWPTVCSSLRVWWCILVFCSFPLLHLVYIVQKRASDLMETCEEIMLVQVSMTVMLKFNIFLSGREKMYALIEAFKTIHERVVEAEFQGFEKCRDLHTKLGRIYFISTMLVATLYLLNALTATVSLSMQTGELRFVTPMNFPYNYQHPVVFILSLVYNLDAMIIFTCISMTADTCFSELANFLALHFDVIGKRFAALDFSGPATAPTARRELLELIAYHGELLELAGKMVRRFQQVIFFMLFLGSTILCLLGYEFVAVTSVSKRLLLVTMASIVTSQAVIYTYNGSIITEESARVSDAIYASNWYEATPEVKKMIYYCLMRAQKPVVMKGGFIEATLPTLKKDEQW